MGKGCRLLDLRNQVLVAFGSLLRIQVVRLKPAPNCLVANVRVASATSAFSLLNLSIAFSRSAASDTTPNAPSSKLALHTSHRHQTHKDSFLAKAWVAPKITALHWPAHLRTLQLCSVRKPGPRVGLSNLSI